MQVSVETLSGLERKVTISVPSIQLEEEVTLRLKDIARKAKIDGFRPGKAPFSVIKSHYALSARDEAARKLAQTTLQQALVEKEFFPADYPALEIEALEEGQDFKFNAVFEVFPEIEVKELAKGEVEITTSEVASADVDEMLEKLRAQNKTWVPVERAVESGDKVKFDFKGFINDEAFEGGEANNFELEIGSGSMIPGFEDGLMGHKAGQTFDIQVTFPENYGHEPLAGKDARFNIALHEVLEGKLPELDDEFAALFNLKEGGMDALRKDIKLNMARELDRRLSQLNRDATFEALRAANAFDVPKALIEKEIKNLMHEMYHQIFGPQHHDNEKIPDFPKEMFLEQAQKRVHMGLLFGEYVKKHNIAVTDERVEQMLEKISSAYESPEELKQWYKTSKERLAELEALVLEEMVSEKILEDATLKSKTLSYNEVTNPNKAQKGE